MNKLYKCCDDPDLDCNDCTDTEAQDAIERAKCQHEDQYEAYRQERKLPCNTTSQR